MGARLATDVHVDRDGVAVLLEAGSELPKWAKSLVTNPKAFVPLEREEAGDGNSSEDDEPKDYADQTIDQLKDLLKERELPVSGSKGDLVERLEFDDLEREEAGDGNSAEDDEKTEE